MERHSRLNHTIHGSSGPAEALPPEKYVYERGQALRNKLARDQNLLPRVNKQ